MRENIIVENQSIELRGKILDGAGHSLTFMGNDGQPPINLISSKVKNAVIRYVRTDSSDVAFIEALDSTALEDVTVDLRSNGNASKKISVIYTDSNNVSIKNFKFVSSGDIGSYIVFAGPGTIEMKGSIDINIDQMNSVIFSEGKFVLFGNANITTSGSNSPLAIDGACIFVNSQKVDFNIKNSYAFLGATIYINEPSATVTLEVADGYNVASKNSDIIFNASPCKMIFEGSLDRYDMTMVTVQDNTGGNTIGINNELFVSKEKNTTRLYAIPNSSKWTKQ